MKSVRWSMSIALLICALPVASPFIASAIASANGCQLNEGNVNPCIIAGLDWGDVLYSMFVMGWFMLMTIPAAAMIVLGWAIFEAVQLFRRRAG